MCDKCTNPKHHNETYAEREARKNKMQEQGTAAGKAVADTLVGGVALLGKSTLWLTRVTTNLTVGASKGIAKEWKRQQKDGF